MTNSLNLDLEKYFSLLTTKLELESEHARKQRDKLEAELHEIKKGMTTKRELDEISGRVAALETEVNKRLDTLNVSIDKRLKPIENKDKLELLAWRIIIPILTGLGVLYFGGFLQ